MEYRAIGYTLWAKAGTVGVFLNHGYEFRLKPKPQTGPRAERDRLLVLATKHCPYDHPDLVEIVKIADGVTE